MTEPCRIEALDLRDFDVPDPVAVGVGPQGEGEGGPVAGVGPDVDVHCEKIFIVQSMPIRMAM